jgi:hypothetical protein
MLNAERLMLNAAVVRVSCTTFNGICRHGSCLTNRILMYGPAAFLWHVMRGGVLRDTRQGSSSYLIALVRETRTMAEKFTLVVRHKPWRKYQIQFKTWP